MFPALRPLWRWMAEHLPDAAQTENMRARSKVGGGGGGGATERITTTRAMAITISPVSVSHPCAFMLSLSLYTVLLSSRNAVGYCEP